jgi:hypothetical protein
MRGVTTLVVKNRGISDSPINDSGESIKNHAYLPKFEDKFEKASDTE